MATNMQSTVKRAIRVLGKYYIDPIDSSVDLLHLLSEFIGIVDDKVSRPLILQRQMLPFKPSNIDSITEKGQNRN